MKKKVYIAGPITNNPNYKENFAAVAEKLKELGLEPVNPADAPEGLTYKEYIDRGLKLLMDCDMICCMTISNPTPRNWLPESRGERLEAHYAITTDTPIIRAEPWAMKGKGEWIISIPKCWPGMFGEEAEPCEK